MAGNASPLFVGTPVTTVSSNLGTSANTATDGTGTVSTVFTAGANGGFIRRLRFKATGTNVATVARIFINNGSATTTAANNALFGELPMAATTASNSIAIGPDYEYTMNTVLEAGYVVTVCFATAVAAGMSITAEGGSY